MKPLQWHFLTLLLLAAFVWMFTLGRGGLPGVHLWNRAFADASFVLLCLALIIGPLARMAPSASAFIPWRRPVGIWMTIAAVAHVVIYAVPTYRLNLLGFVAEMKQGRAALMETPYAASNWIGFIAILYSLVLALSSNNYSVRLLGQGWKFLQQQSYTLFVLTALHTGLFLYLVIKQGFGIFPYAFWAGVILTVGFQLTGYLIFTGAITLNFFKIPLLKSRKERR